MSTHQISRNGRSRQSKIVVAIVITEIGTSVGRLPLRCPHEIAVNGVVFVVHDAVRTEREFQHLVERGKLAPIWIGGVAWLSRTGYVRSPDPYQPHPHVDRLACGLACRNPGGVVLLARTREHDRPQTRAAVAVDTRNNDARARLLYQASHGGSEDVVLLFDRIFGLVHVDFGLAPKRLIGMRPEEITRLADRNLMPVRICDVVAQARIEPIMPRYRARPSAWQAKPLRVLTSSLLRQP